MGYELKAKHAFHASRFPYVIIIIIIIVIIIINIVDVAR